jgi:thioredoxin reductase (NADPH)
MTLIETRGPQLFPVLDAGQIETAKRFASGPARDFTGMTRRTMHKNRS